MNVRNLSLFLVITLFVSSCNLPTNAPVENDRTVAPSPTLENTPLPPEATALPSETPLPTDTPLPTPTGTPTTPIAWPKDVGVNCRFGPGVEWLAIGALLVEQTATIQGKNASGTWWFVTTPNAPGNPCWVANSVTNTAGNLANVPVINPPEASAINISLDTPDTITVAGCLGPIQPMKLEGSIETNGPGTIEWHFATEQGGALPSYTTDFAEFGSKNVSDDSYTPPLAPGTYWVRLVVTSPNSEQAEKMYKIECP